MNFYFAPMEGVTGYIYRNAHHDYFPGIDRYYSPFITTNQKGTFRSRERNDILPENNQGIQLIPQILTNHAEQFIETSKKIKELGYTEINLNLGCPSGTVVSKKRGAGFLSCPEELNRFLEQIFDASVTKISIKTRLGLESPEEFYDLLELYNQYPIEEIIIHPRTQKDFYKNQPNRTIYKEAIALSKNPVCYNGDIFTINDYTDFVSTFPEERHMMLGRGLIRNPALVTFIQTGTSLDKKIFREFHNRLYEDYRVEMSGERNVLFRMKQLWFFMIELFSNHEKYAKKIKKAQHLKEYEEAIDRLFAEQELI